MSDVFLSYAAPDRAVAQKFADALEALGWSVWWDREIPFGKPFDQVIEEELNAARCVVVLWTRESVHSRWVKTEAAAAVDRDRLLPVLLEDVQIPLEFRRVQTAMLHGWSGDRDHPEFVLLLDSVKQMVGSPAGRDTATRAQPAPPPVSASRWRTMMAAAMAVAIVAGIMLWQGGTGRRLAEPRVGQTPEARQVAEVVPQATTTAATQQQKPSSATAGAVAAAAVSPTSQKAPYRIRIGDIISEGVPGPGAGHIENPGVRDIYVFDVKGGERIYFRLFEHGKGMELIEWKLTDPDGGVVFDGRLGYGDPGVHVLRKGGTYTMIVGSDRVSGTGTYRLQLTSAD